MRITCPECSAHYDLGEEMQGAKVQCAQCGTKFFIYEDGSVHPVPKEKNVGKRFISDKPDITCPKCGTRYSLGEKIPRKQLLCDECGTRFLDINNITCPECGIRSRLHQAIPASEEPCAGCGPNFYFIFEDGSVQSVPQEMPAAPKPPPPPQVNEARYSQQGPAKMENRDMLGDWLSDQELLDDFVVERTLGEGGMGKVYLLKSRTNGSRFAVKRAKGFAENDRRNFLAELQTWIDLPEHGNLVPCRFFRSIGDEILIFAEYVEGGSLKEWIDSERLYEGGHAQALERMLDVAIQFAWGLHCLHELGLIHQDVKPGNVLMAVDGSSALQGVQPRVTDYGLARARAAGGERPSADPSRSIVVSCGGGTPAYCSPEQASGQALSRKADLWSWGVSVLEMFTGGVTWMAGQAAGEVLEAFLGDAERNESIPAMPTSLVNLLKETFRLDPDFRPCSAEELALRLKRIYREVVGRDYPRDLHGIELKVSMEAGIRERRDKYGNSWGDPKGWLVAALRASGRDPAEAEAMIAETVRTRRGALVAELAMYDEARRIYERLVQSGRKDLEVALAGLCADAAQVHMTADDAQGCLALYEQAISILARLVHGESRRELANHLATAYMRKANAVSDLGDKREAVALHDQVIVLLDRLVHEKGGWALANDLARAYMNKATAVSDLGDHRGAVALYDQVIAIRERLVHEEGQREFADDLATAYMNKAVAVSHLGDKRGAVALYDQARAIWERLVHEEDRQELANVLAITYLNKAVAIRDLGDNRGAVALYDQAIAIQERLVHEEGRRELANYLAAAYMNKGDAVRALGDNRGAVALYDQAIAIQKRLVHEEGRRELANYLATAYTRKANAVSDLGDNSGAVALYDQAIAIRDRLVNVDGRRELADELATAYVNKANVVRALGDNRGAVALHDQAIAILERLVHVEGRWELAKDLANAYTDKAAAVSALGDKSGAVALYDQAIAILERLVHAEGRRELANYLAIAYQNKANAVSALGDHRGAVALYDQAIATWERLVHAEGRRELANYLAITYLNKAIEIRALVDNHGAVALYDQAIAIWERLVHAEGRQELANYLATAYVNKAATIGALGDHRGAAALFVREIVDRERLVHVDGRGELLGDFGAIQGCYAIAMLQSGQIAAGLEAAQAAKSTLESEYARSGQVWLKQNLEYLEKEIAKHST